MMRKDPIFKTLMLTRKGTFDKPVEASSDPSRFGGEGLTYRAKLIGVLEVSAPRGDRLCQEALGELKMAVKAAGEHKQRIMICVALDGLRLRDERTGDCLYHHAVHKISFIAQDMADPRAFGYIYGSPDQGHRFFGIKTDKQANLVVAAMRDLFQVVYDLKKRDVDKTSQNTGLASRMNGSGCFSYSSESLDRVFTMGSQTPQTADLLDFQGEEKSLDSFDPFSSWDGKELEVFSGRPSVAPTNLPPALPPPPSSASCQLSTVIPVSPKTKSAFPEKFTELFPTANLTPLVPPPTKTLKTKIDSSTVSHYSTIRPRKKSSKDTVSTFATTSSKIFSPPISEYDGEQPSDKQFGPPEFSNASFYPKCNSSFNHLRVSSIQDSSNASLNSVIQSSVRDKFDLQPFFSDNRGHETLFTELDPLSAGNNRPYLDNKYFFQDLKRSTNAPNDNTNDHRANLEISQSSFSSSHVQAKPERSCSSQPSSGIQSKTAEINFFELSELKKDPFDTNFVSSTSLGAHSVVFHKPEQVPTTCFEVPPLTFPSISLEKEKASKSPSEFQFRADDFFQSNECAAPLSSTPSSPRPDTTSTQTAKPGIRVETEKSKNQPMFEVIGQIKSEACTFSLAASKIVDQSHSPRPKFASGKYDVGLQHAATPRHLSEEADSSSSDEPGNFFHSPTKDTSSWNKESDKEIESSPKLKTLSQSCTGSNSATKTSQLFSPPQPPPRPPVLRPPPLPPKGQAPHVPNRPNSAVSEDSSCGHATPPLPVPMRKAKHVTSPKSNILSHQFSHSDSNSVGVERDEETHRGKLLDASSSLKSNQQQDVNSISLLQLSNMSLSDLAATLKLPPVRIASMTLTELALRLNELNHGFLASQEISSRVDKQVVKFDENDDGHQDHLYSGFLERSVGLNADSGDDDDEDYDEEEEQDAIEVEEKSDDTEVCYKGGKKYEMLSDVHEQEQEEDLDVEGQKLLKLANNAVTLANHDGAQSSDNDRYAALREIMEQDLASNLPSELESPEKAVCTCDVKFADFDNATQVFELSQANIEMSASSLLHQAPNRSSIQHLGFEDDFSKLSLVCSKNEEVGTHFDSVPMAYESEISEAQNTSTVTSIIAEITSEQGKEDSCDSDFASFPFCSSLSAGVLEEAKQIAIESNELVSDANLHARKLASFEARFSPNPSSGFADSFVEVQQTVLQKDSVKIAPVALLQSEVSFDVDFDSAFDANTEDDQVIRLPIRQEPFVRKSVSVNIFNRVDDPFDDDFFHPSSSSNLFISAPVNPPESSKSCATIIEDPFVWAQPFDDNVIFEDSSET